MIHRGVFESFRDAAYALALTERQLFDAVDRGDAALEYPSGRGGPVEVFERDFG
ncbi:MAG: hypothetical protein GY882_04365 [Actinomycetia bacterium]|nr:hypothetical protein [Actinomycetes bacterium]